MRTPVVLLLIGLVVAGGVYYTAYLRGEDPPNFRTAGRIASTRSWGFFTNVPHASVV